MDLLIRLIQRPGLRQFIKFVIIGASSAVIDISVAQLLMFKLGMPWIPAGTLSFILAVTNGYFWNSRWTFRGLGSGQQHELYVKFVMVNIVGLVLNIGIMKSLFILMSGQIIQHHNPPKWQWYIAKAAAIIIVAIWNFMANKFWTFRHTPPTGSPPDEPARLPLSPTVASGEVLRDEEAVALPLAGTRR